MFEPLVALALGVVLGIVILLGCLAVLGLGDRSREYALERALGQILIEAERASRESLGEVARLARRALQ